MLEHYNNLALAIVTRAVEDYNFLKNNGLQKFDFIDEGKISKREIANFLKSDWCKFLLSSTEFTGEDILKRLTGEV